MAKPSVFPIKPDDLDKVWGVLKKYIEESMEYGLRTHGIDDVYHGIKDKSFVLWSILSAQGKRCGAAVTAVENYPLLKIGVVRWLGGCDIKDWFETSHKVLASWARLNGCHVLRHEGRAGWVKILEPYGYKSVGHACLLSLDNLERAKSCQVAAAEVKPPQQLPHTLHSMTPF